MRSNCLLEALKAKFKNRKCEISFSVPHFGWCDGENYYDFIAQDKDIPLWKILWCDGEIRILPLDWGQDEEEHF